MWGGWKVMCGEVTCDHSLQPVLTREACDLISVEYTKLRAQETVGRDKAKVGGLRGWPACQGSWPGLHSRRSR